MVCHKKKKRTHASKYKFYRKAVNKYSLGGLECISTKEYNLGGDF